MRRFLGLVTALGMVFVMAVSSGTASAASVSPATFTSQVCGAIATSVQALQANVSTFKDAAAAYKAAPSPTTAAALRDAYAQAFAGVDQQMGVVLAAVAQAGTPSGGASFVAGLQNALHAQQVAAQQFAQQAAAIDTSSLSTFGTALQHVDDAAKTRGKTLRRAVKANAAIKHAARVYHPLVSVLTTDANTCPKR